MSDRQKQAELFKQLSEFFPRDAIQWRIGNVDEFHFFASMIPFVDARTIENRLDEVLGPLAWRNSFVEVVTGNRISAIRCRLEICVEGVWYFKEDGAHVDPGQRIEFAVKGAYSDALKRVAVQWGIGRYLAAMSKASLSVPVEERHTLSSGQKVYSVMLAPAIPPDFVRDEEKEQAEQDWTDFNSKRNEAISAQEKAQKEFEAAQQKRAEEKRQGAMSVVQAISDGSVSTHLPSTDEFSLRQPLVAKPQVAEGQAPASVADLLGGALSGRTGGKDSSRVLKADVATQHQQDVSLPAENPQAAQTPAVEETHSQDSTTAEQSQQPSSFEAAENEDIGLTTVTAAERVEAQQTPEEQQPETPAAAKAATPVRRGRNSALDSRAAAAAAAAAQAITGLSNIDGPAEKSASAPETKAEDAEAGKPADQAAEPEKTKVTEQAGSGSDVTLTPEQQVLYDNTLEKIRGKTMPKTMIERYVTGPRLKDALPAEAIERLRGEVEIHFN